MNNSTSDISNHIRGFDIGSRIFFFLRSVFGVTLHAGPNISKSFSYLYGISPLEDNTEHLSSLNKNI